MDWLPASLSFPRPGIHSIKPCWMPAFERVKESHFCVWRGLKFVSLVLAAPAVRVAKGRKVLGASWGFDPQAVGGGEIVGERMPERMRLRLDQPAHGKKAKAMVLAVGVDPL